jgi:hypothetical protein
VGFHEIFRSLMAKSDTRNYRQGRRYTQVRETRESNRQANQ